MSADASSNRQPDRRTYTVDEAAAQIGISRSFAYELVKTGRIRAIPLGRRIVIPKRWLDEFIDSGWEGPNG